MNSPDIIKYKDTNKVGMIEYNVSSTFFKEEDKVDYYEEK